MNKPTRVALLAPVLVAIAAPAFADTLYASAGYSGAETGDYNIGNDFSGGYDLIAAQFTLTQAAQITSVGGVFTQYGDGNPIFAAIIATPASQSSVNLSTISSLALAETTFTPPQDNSDATAALSATLAAGSYELVFGAGAMFNGGQAITGQSGLASGQNGSATLLQSLNGGNTWGTLTDSVRVTVDGTPSPVPLPPALPLFASALGGVGWLARRKRATTPVFGA